MGGGGVWLNPYTFFGTPPPPPPPELKLAPHTSEPLADYYRTLHQSLKIKSHKAVKKQ
jgi:hypothetical protein